MILAALDRRPVALPPPGRSRTACLAASLALVASGALLAGCSSTPTASTAPSRSVNTGSGGYYLDDGPGSGAPADPDAVADAVPRRETLLARANRPYVVFGVTYVPRTELGVYRERGSASWYGRKFHGAKTSTGEVYNMYSMTAAHPTLPLPSYVRVTNLSNGKSVVVRVNDRGPFLNNRLIDLSWTAAARLGYVGAGHTKVEVEQITRFDGDDGMPVRPAPTLASAAILSSTATATASSVSAAGVTVTPLAGGNDTRDPMILRTATAGGEPASGAGADRMAGGSVDAGVTAASSLAVEAIVASAAAVPVADGMSASAAPISTAVTGGSHYVQLAAFNSREGAEAGRQRVSRQADWLAAPVEVRLDGGLYKLQAGPFAQRDDARQTVERLRQTTELKPFLTAR